MCHVCETTGQTCDYPQRAMKPGPKIGKQMETTTLFTKRSAHRHAGSTQRQRKRLHRRCQSSSTIRVGSPSIAPPTSPETLETGQYHHPGGRSRGPVHDEETTPLQCPRVSRPSKGSQQGRDSRLDMHDLSFILHPSHEASTPDDKQTPSSTGGGGGVSRENEALLQQACSILGLSPTMTEHMYACTLSARPCAIAMLLYVKCCSLGQIGSGYTSRTWLQSVCSTDRLFPRS